MVAKSYVLIIVNPKATATSIGVDVIIHEIQSTQNLKLNLSQWNIKRKAF